MRTRRKQLSFEASININFFSLLFATFSLSEFYLSVCIHHVSPNPFTTNKASSVANDES